MARAPRWACEETARAAAAANGQVSTCIACGYSLHEGVSNPADIGVVSPLEMSGLVQAAFASGPCPPETSQGPGWNDRIGRDVPAWVRPMVEGGGARRR